MKAHATQGIVVLMQDHSITLLLAFAMTTAIPSLASADDAVTTKTASNEPPKLTLFTSAGYLGAGSGSGAALATGIRYAIGSHFAVGLDLGYGVIAQATTMEDRWWLIPSMAAVIPARIGGIRATFDIGAGLGLGTASGYGSWSEYASHPFTATWEFQLVPAVRAHAIASFAASRSVDIFVRADAAALVLPHGVGAGVSDSTWMMFALGTRFRLL